MTDTRFSRLSHLEIIRIQGPDALKFLQGQCTQDVMKLTPEAAQPGAFCTAKGRTVTNCWLYAHQTDDVILVCHRDSAPLLAKHLSKYIAFFRGTQLHFEPQRYQLTGLFERAEQLTNAINAAAVVLPWFTTRSLLCCDVQSSQAEQIDQQLSQLQALPESHWQAEDIAQRCLWLDADQHERWIPQNYSLDELGGISFEKGCYTGQEVVARLHYKGQSKKQLFALTWQDTSACGKEIFQHGKIVGDVLNQASTAQGQVALAIVKTDAINEPLWLDKEQQIAIELLH